MAISRVPRVKPDKIERPDKFVELKFIRHKFKILIK